MASPSSYTIVNVFNDIFGIFADINALLTGKSIPIKTNGITIPAVVSSSQKTNSTTTTPAPPVVDPTYIWTGVLILLGGFLCIIQLFASIFGRRMHLQTIRWHTVGYNCWNIVFLLLYADLSTNSPWQGYLFNHGAVMNKIHLEQMFLCVFPIGVLFLLPLVAIESMIWGKNSHPPVFFVITLGLFMILSIAPALLFWIGSLELYTTSSINGTSLGAATNQVPNAPIEWVAFWAALVVWAELILFTLAIIVILVIVILVELYYLLMQPVFGKLFSAISKIKSPNKILLNRSGDEARLRTSNSLAFLLLFDQLFLALLIWLLLLAHLTPTIVVLESFGVDQLWPIIKNMISSATAGGGTGTGTSPAGSGNQMNQLAIKIDLLTRLTNINTWLSTSKDVFELSIPILEFLATVLLIRAYREQHLNLLSCSTCYHEEQPGSVWHFFRKVNKRISKEKRIKPEANFLISNGLQATARPERSMVQTKQTQVGPQILTLKVGGNQQIASPGNQQQALLASQRIRSFNGSMNNRGECSNNMRNGMPPIAH